MESSATIKAKFWQRRWFWQGVWSAAAAMGTVFWQAQDNVYWTQSRNGSTNPGRIISGLFIYFILVFAATGFFVRAWRHLPARWSARIWLGGVSVAAGILWNSYLLNWDGYEWIDFSNLMFLGWTAFWSFLVMTGLLFLFSLVGMFRWLVRWRVLKRILLASAALLFLGVALRMVADWRGKRAWDNYRREWEAKGESFDLAALAPPPVRDELNFAMAPIVSNSLAGRWIAPTNREHDTDKKGMGLAPLAMKLERTNCILTTNCIMGVWQMARPTNLKGWQEYYRTRFVTNEWFVDMPGMPGMPGMLPPSGGILPNLSPTNEPSQTVTELSTDEFPIADQPQTPADDVLLALGRYDGVLAELAEAARRPQSRFPVQYASEYPQMIELPQLDVLKKCAMVLQLRAIANLEAGKSEQALNDVKLMLRLADAIRGEPMMFSYLVRLTIAGLAVQPVWEGLAGGRWSEAELKELGRLLGGLDLVAEWQIALRGERAELINYVEQQRKRRDETAGFLLLATWPGLEEKLISLERCIPDLPEFPHPITRSLEAFAQCLPMETIERGLMKLPPDGWYEWNKVALARHFQEQLLKVADVQKHLLNRRDLLAVGEMFSRKYGSRDFGPHDALLFRLLPATTYAAQRIAAVQSAVDMAKVACALERYRLARGGYPTALAALVPDYLGAIPPDVAEGGMLHFQCADNGHFTLYSIGWNGKDDGGVVGTNQFGRFIPNNGDWIWRYPAK